MVSMNRGSDVRDIARGYFHAWTCGEIEVARHFLSERLDFRGRIDTFESADRFVGALRKFQKTLKSTSLFKEFYSPGAGMLLYNCVTNAPAGTIRTAEHFGVREGGIFEILLISDVTKLHQFVGRLRPNTN